MSAQTGEDVYASLLLTDTYLPGALVLAHSLRDAGTTKKLACLVTSDSVSAEPAYDYVIPVPRIENPHPANLDLMNRRDLRAAFTKINLWKQTQFRKIVYLDADVVAYRAPDELFDLPHPFAAAPDIGWPDLFNTGVMVLTPNMDDYQALMAMAQQGTSFDGADQGLLNIYFKDGFHRLSFTYNVTPSAHYQYVPAYTHFQSNINLVHFIGAQKPWMQERETSTGGSPFGQMVAKWWAVYDRHYRAKTPSGTVASAPSIVQYFVKGEFRPTMSYVVPVGEQASWDAQRQPPPTGSKGEAVNFPHKHYAMSSDTTPFVPRETSSANVSTAVAEEAPSAPPTPPAPTTHAPAKGGSDMWSSFPRTNAWDDVPEINRYIERRMPWYLRHQPGRIKGLPADETELPPGVIPRRGSRVTDFPTSDERPSLPVTPAPVRRPRSRRGSGRGGLGGEGEPQEEGWEDEQLPAAEGVPPQSEWVCVHGIRWGPADCLCDYLANVLRLTYHKDPAERLRKLAREQSEMLFRRLSSVGSVDHDEGESTITAPSVFSTAETATGDGSSITTYATSIPVVSPRFVKPPSPVMQRMLADAPEIMLPASAYYTKTKETRAPEMAEPSYRGPGAMFEKGEDVPTSQRAALPTEEERDVLET
ncbi:hypothetical protein VTJ49DRAFT_174 [Mycothermus thermophilus]|uniref:Glycogenin n=1 Tax=Humicola insolens TaxID=85995 RepID=A0ABR3VFW0_HUMIN